MHESLNGIIINEAHVFNGATRDRIISQIEPYVGSKILLFDGQSDPWIQLNLPQSIINRMMEAPYLRSQVAGDIADIVLSRETSRIVFQNPSSFTP